jgi:indole-3-glycerol phosphate synthase
MTILDKIISNKKEEVAYRKTLFSVEKLLETSLYQRSGHSLVNALNEKEGTGIIAEYKRRSPSKGVINNTADVGEVTAAYSQYGASGLSVLTDKVFFGGSLEDLSVARKNNIPLLRKDFIVDAYQLTESKSYGADVILLIAACLSKNQTKELADQAKKEGLEVLLELHNEEELDHICASADMVGINSRNLKTFEVDREASLRMVKMIPAGKPIIAESGINNPGSLLELRRVGFKGFLIGEHFMKTINPAQAFKTFVQSLNK